MSTARVSNATFRSLRHTRSRPQSHARPRNGHAHSAYARSFHCSPRLDVVRPYLLADIGEGITECQIIQWFVQPGARVAQFDKICEVQSDKAAVEITSRFDGVIKKLHYEADDMAKVGAPLVDIDIAAEEAEEGADVLGGGSKDEAEAKGQAKESPERNDKQEKKAEVIRENKASEGSPPPPGKHATLATPAVRHLVKQFDINIADISGTGRDGRVLKEDVHKFVESKQSRSAGAEAPSAATTPQSQSTREDKTIQLSGIQRKMFQTMTHSLTIPHFLYSDPVDFTSLSRIRKSINTQTNKSKDSPKLSALPFIMKAVSLALLQYPQINAHLNTSNADAPKFTHKASHNIGFAVDTPQGLIVPNIKNVQNHGIASLAAEIARLGSLARSNKLSAADLSDTTFTVSNIGAIGGATVAPVIVAPQVAILGVGKARAVPAFDERGEVVRREEAVFSWSADHRVVDGATVARCAELVRRHLENFEGMLVQLR